MNGISRRAFNGVAIASTLASSAASSPPLFAADLPPVRAITKGPKFHWFGYYDKLQFDPANRLVLGNEVTFEHRSPMADDSIRVGMVDLHEADRWMELGQSRAWNWQQGCMLQWRPDSDGEVLWNDREGDKFVCHILNTKTNQRRTIPSPVYCVSPDGRWGLSPDFRRLNDCRPGYGYTGIPDPHRDHPAPADAGIWRIDLETGDSKLILSIQDVMKIRTREPYSAGAKHWFNHLLVSPDGKRFIFLHRWRGDKEGKGFATGLFTADLDGQNLYELDPYGKTSHFVWRDADHVIAWAWHPSHGEKFYLYKDRTEEVEVVAKDVMTVNGHVSYLPGNKWILNDTYPDKDRLQHPYLYQVESGTRLPLGHFRSPPEYAGEWRCDTHPRFSRDGKLVCIDSPHAPGRQMYLIDVDGVS